MFSKPLIIISLFFLILSFPVFTYSEECGKSFRCWNSALEDTMTDLSMSTEQKDFVRDYILGHFFIDSPDYQFHLLDKPPKPWLFYNNTGGDPYGNFKKTWYFLIGSKKELNLELIVQIHTKMMEGGVEGLASNKLGIFRRVEIIGTGPYANKSIRLPRETCDNINSDEYANFDENNRGACNINSSDRYGIIKYPYILHPDKILNKVSPEFAEEIKAYIANSNKPQEKTEAMNYRLMQELLKDLFTWFNSNKDNIEPVKLASEAQKRFVSIHPFMNGNGRTSRMLLNYILYLSDIVPSIIRNPNEDLYKNYAEWEKEVNTGINNSIKLYADTIKRLKDKSNLFYSSSVLSSYIPESNSKGVKLNPDFFKQYFFIMRTFFDETREMDKNWEHFELIEFLKNKFLQFSEKYFSLQDNNLAGLTPVTMDYSGLLKKAFSTYKEAEPFLSKYYSKNYLKLRVTVPANLSDDELKNFFFSYSKLFTTSVASEDYKTGFDSCAQDLNKEIFTEKSENLFFAALKNYKTEYLMTARKGDNNPQLAVKNEENAGNFLKNLFIKEYPAELIISAPKEGAYSSEMLSRYMNKLAGTKDLIFIACGIRPEAVQGLTLYDKTGNGFKYFKRENSDITLYDIKDKKLIKKTSYSYK